MPHDHHYFLDTVFVLEYFPTIILNICLSPILFNFASEYAIGKNQAKWREWKWMYQFLLRGENLLGEIIDTEIENGEASSDTTKESGLEISARNTKYMSMHCEQNAAQNHNIKVGIQLYESPAKFKYLGTQMKTTFMKKLRTD